MMAARFFCEISSLENDNRRLVGKESGAKKREKKTTGMRSVLDKIYD
jgi:hypothetical protein